MLGLCGANNARLKEIELPAAIHLCFPRDDCDIWIAPLILEPSMPFDAAIDHLRKLAARARGRVVPQWDPDTPQSATTIPPGVRRTAILIALILTVAISMLFAVLTIPL